MQATSVEHIPYIYVAVDHGLLTNMKQVKVCLSSDKEIVESIVSHPFHNNILKSYVVAMATY